MLSVPGNFLSIMILMKSAKIRFRRRAGVSGFFPIHAVSPAYPVKGRRSRCGGTRCGVDSPASNDIGGVWYAGKTVREEPFQRQGAGFIGVPSKTSPRGGDFNPVRFHYAVGAWNEVVFSRSRVGGHRGCEGSRTGPGQSRNPPQRSGAGGRSDVTRRRRGAREG